MARVEITTGDIGEDIQEFVGRMEATGTMGYTADYAEFVNYPTAYAGSPPPFAPLRKWVHRKWNDLDDAMKDAAYREGMTVSQHKDAVANMVRFAIAENGTKGIYFMERAVERATNAADAIADQYENSEDPEAPFKVLVDLLDFAFGQSQEIVADEATDTGNLLQSGYVDVSQLQGPNRYENSGGGGGE